MGQPFVIHFASHFAEVHVVKLLALFSNTPGASLV